MLFITPFILIASLMKTFGVFVEEDQYLVQPPLQYTYEWNVNEHYNFWEFNFTMTSLELVNVTCVLPMNVSYALVGIHSFVYEIKLVFGEATEYVGSNVGLLMSPVSKRIVFSLINPHGFPMRILGLITPFKGNDPLPGGSVSSSEVMPYMETQVTQNVVKLKATAAKTEPTLHNYPYEMRYIIYYMYTQEKDYSADTYFNAIKRMTNMSGDMREVMKELTVVDGKIEVIFANYPGTGVYYNLLIEGLHGKSSYVVAHTFGCKNVRGDISGEFQGSTFHRVLSVILCVFGFLLCFNGVKWESFEVALQSFLLTSLVLFIIMSQFIPPQGSLAVCTSVSVVVSFLMAFYFIRYNLKWMHHIISFVNISFFVSAFLLFFINLAIPAVISTEIYWVVFVCCSLFAMLLCIIHITISHYITTSVIGSYLMILCLDYFAGSSLKYIVFDNIRRIIDTDFRLAIISPPFQTPEKVQIALWLFLFFLGLALQYFGWMMFLDPGCVNPQYECTPVCYRSRYDSDDCSQSNSTSDDISIGSYQGINRSRNDPCLSCQITSRTPLNSFSYPGCIKHAVAHVQIPDMASISYSTKYYDCSEMSDSYPESESCDDESAPLTKPDPYGRWM